MGNGERVFAGVSRSSDASLLLKGRIKVGGGGLRNPKAKGSKAGKLFSSRSGQVRWLPRFRGEGKGTFMGKSNSRSVATRYPYT